MNHNSEFLKLVDDAKTRIKEISAEEVLAMLKITSPLRGEVAERSEAGGGESINKNTPSLTLPPQGGGDLILIDTREESEFAAGRIPGSVHLSKGIIECYIEGKVPDKNAPIVLYCGGGYRSALAADNLQKMGYTNVFSMAGGWRGWNERGFPVTCG